MSIIIGMAGECQQITDQNQWTTVRTEDMVKAHFPCIFARVIETPWYTGGMSCHQLFVLLCHSATLSKQSRGQHFHSNYTHPTSSSRDKTCTLSLSIITKSSERAQDFPTVPIFVTEKVHVGIERNRATPTKLRTGSSRRCPGGSWHMVDFCPGM